ncbi:hypothetical protein D3C86_1415670 [compost metagenome]
MQVAREPLQHAAPVAGAHVAGTEFGLGALAADQQLAAVAGIQAPSAAGVEQVVGPRHPQQEMPGKIHSLQGNPQSPCQLQGDQGQRQRLSAAALDDLVQQGDLRARRAVVFAKIQLAQAPQQRLRQFLRRQGGQAEADLLLQRGEFTQHLGRLQRRIVFGGNP